MNLHRYPQLVDVLAAEFALGTLRGGARRRLQFYSEHDAVIRTLIGEWEQRLAPMAELAMETRMPPAGVWEAIERRLGFVAARDANRAAQAASAPAAARPAPARSDWLHNLAFWRGWAIGVTAIAAIAVIVAVRALLPGAGLQQPTQQIAQQPASTVAPAAPESVVSHVAVLNDKASHPVLIVAWDETHSTMSLHKLGVVPLPVGHSLELWGIPANGHPVSLGLMPDDAEGKVAASSTQKPESYQALAISVELKGGSKDPNGPTGPVMWSGRLVPLT